MNNVVISCVVLESMQHMRVDLAEHEASLSVGGSIDAPVSVVWRGPLADLGPALRRLARASAQTPAFVFDSDAS